MFEWSDADDEPRCGVMFTDQLVDNGLLQLHFDDDNLATWQRCGRESTREIVYISVVLINNLGTVFAVIAMVVFRSLINLHVLNLSAAK